MGDMDEDQFQARLRALEEQFAASLPATFAEIARLHGLCVAEGPRPELLEGLSRRLHSVSGAAGTFGYAILGRACRRIEEDMRTHMQDAAGVAAHWPQLDGDLQRLLQFASTNPKGLPV